MVWYTVQIVALLALSPQIPEILAYVNSGNNDDVIILKYLLQPNFLIPSAFKSFAHTTHCFVLLYSLTMASRTKEKTISHQKVKQTKPNQTNKQIVTWSEHTLLHLTFFVTMTML